MLAQIESPEATKCVATFFYSPSITCLVLASGRLIERYLESISGLAGVAYDVQNIWKRCYILLYYSLNIEAQLHHFCCHNIFQGLTKLLHRKPLLEISSFTVNGENF